MHTISSPESMLIRDTMQPKSRQESAAKIHTTVNI